MIFTILNFIIYSYELLLTYLIQKGTIHTCTSSGCETAGNQSFWSKNLLESCPQAALAPSTTSILQECIVSLWRVLLFLSLEKIDG